MSAEPTHLPDPAQSHVVLIGFARYSHAHNLPAVENNLEALQEFFTSAAGWGLPDGHCHVIRQAATADDLLAPLHSAAEAARDTLLVYYAGHGILSEDVEFSLSLPASQLDKPWTGVSYTWVRQCISRARAKRRVAILDSCFSGKAHAVMGTTSDVVKERAAATGTTVITSARDDRVALAPVGETYTAFTGELLTVLREGMDDGPAVLTIDQVYDCVKQALKNKERPRPDRTGSDTCGRTPIALNRAFVPAVPAAESSDRTHRHRHLREWAVRLQAKRSEPTDTASAPAPMVQPGPASTGTAGERTDGSRPPAKNNTPPGAGKTFANGRYESIALVGAGGMGEIYLGRDTLLGRTIAIKRMHSDLLEASAEHLRDEARAVAALNHPSIAAVYDVVQEAADQYMIMEYVQGWDLGTGVAAAPPTVQEALAAALDILDGLEHSHAAGIIHCDIKPANLVLTLAGRVKILDFGISSMNESIHQAGAYVGTIMYMPPESLSGAPPHVTRDIFGTGAVLRELITRRHVPQGSGSTTSNSMQPPTRLATPAPDLPAGVQALIEKSIAPLPEMRYSSAAEMRAEVERYL